MTAALLLPAGLAVLDTVAERFGERVGAVAGAVVGQDPLDGHAAGVDIPAFDSKQVADLLKSLRSAGERGPLLMQDHHFREKITHFDHERIPERVVHARGAGAHGFFEALRDDPRIGEAFRADIVAVMDRDPATFRAALQAAGSETEVVVLDWYPDSGNPTGEVPA